ncbi:formimidoylglutamate deiminase [Erwinia sp. OLTSP20]|uniref:formimidoylglutamate deiminase n=1 Tax=unclassified Erwinia TaxID=2622719 RepID=UPI000C17B4D9|nr:MULTISPECIES: formimidoylglutamate deiminase [unclassified Erwinia]PIJ48686.1 formimidoylglutamate deiminase [Erwinia sp. OAMSP11]PIJ69310.1 formimidoylglutamate deiminase [Erwinia sp. OLSSP12]PIJ79144.1 formimidoylglutamate deiminase [Erwinia sp. OLCASP19]PIJ80670.1 formimidoylglutamate deiminase [Erwinia sp. OLMTSP26]PIJ82821.1 formimidoylglutamate deiminase [Erwinia sp. OLMDSP33]
MSRFFAPRALLPQGWCHDVIIEVDDQGTIRKLTPGSPQLDAQRLHGAVVPSLANLHSHAFQRAMAGLAEVAGDPQDSFWTWRDLMYRMVQSLTPEAVGAIATQLYIEMLKGGYTQVAEFHYLHHDTSGQPYQDDAMLQQLMQAAQQSGIGQTLLPVLYSYAGFGAQPAQSGQRRFIQQTSDYLKQQQRLQSWCAQHPLINYGLCFHSLRAVSETQIREVLAAAAPHLPVHIHIAEQEKEVADCLAWSNERPLSWLYKRFNPDSRWCLIHATHLDDDELRQLAASSAVAGICPTTEANLGDGIFRGSDYLALNGRWGIGSDSHVSLDIVEELRWFEYGQRLRDRRRNRLVQREQPSVGDLLFAGARQGGAQACGLSIGALASDYRADWLVLEEDALLGPTGDSALINRWLFAGHRGQIRDVFVAGRQVIHQGQHQYQEQAARLFRQVIAGLT